MTDISTFGLGGTARREQISAGEIGKVQGLGDIRIGDSIGTPRTTIVAHRFPPPTLETEIVPVRPADRGHLRGALTELSNQDPLINVRQDDVRQTIYVSLYGEVQKGVIQETLRNEFHLDVKFRETTTLCIEEPLQSGSAREVIAEGSNPFLATVGIRIDPAPEHSSVFEFEIELGSLPRAFLKAIERTSLETLREGLFGWQVTNCTVTLTESGYWSRQSHSHGTFDRTMSSTAGDFRLLTPLVVMTALKTARTRVLEPIHRFRLDVPKDTAGAVLAALGRLQGVVKAQSTRGPIAILEGDMAAARMRGLNRQLAALTRGEGTLESTFDRYEPVRGKPPRRDRTDNNPLDRKEYLVIVARRT